MNSEAQIIVVDSQAEPDTRTLLKQFPGVQYVPFEKNVGYAKIVNAGIRKATQPYILIINADILIDTRDIEKMQRFLATHPKVGAVGASAGFRFPTLQAVFARRSWWGKTPWGKKTLAHYQMNEMHADEPHRVDWVRGDCWMIKREALAQVGLIDERFFMYMEDTDWCRQAQKKSWDIYFLPGIIVEQKQKGASRNPSIFGIRYRLWHAISFIKYILKWNFLHQNPSNPPFSF